MSGDLAILAWVVLVVGGIGTMQWGAARASSALDGYRGRVGLPGVVAGALLGIATATPEIAVNVASVGFGWPDLGLGSALGSNVPALPLVFLLSWLSLRSDRSAESPDVAVVRPVAVDVQAVPYLLVVLLLALLTLPPAWSGLQPIDAVLLAGAWLLFFRRALRRRRTPSNAPAAREGLARSAFALPALAIGALAAVIAARRLGDAFGASDLVVGLFVIGLLCALPESFTSWRLARDDRTTTAVAAAMSDGIVSLTLALVPPALAGTPLDDAPLYVLNLVLLTAVLLLYVALNHRARGATLRGPKVLAFAGLYVAYLCATGWLLAQR